MVPVSAKNVMVPVSVLVPVSATTRFVGFGDQKSRNEVAEVRFKVPTLLYGAQASGFGVPSRVFLRVQRHAGLLLVKP